MALTDTEIKKAKVREKAYSMGDAGGLGLWVTPAGGRLWCWSYRFEGKEKLMSLRKFPDVPPAQHDTRGVTLGWHSGFHFRCGGSSLEGEKCARCDSTK